MNLSLVPVSHRWLLNESLHDVMSSVARYLLSSVIIYHQLNFVIWRYIMMSERRQGGRRQLPAMETMSITVHSFCRFLSRPRGRCCSRRSTSARAPHTRALWSCLPQPLASSSSIWHMEEGAPRGIGRSYFLLQCLVHRGRSP